MGEWLKCVPIRARKRVAPRAVHNLNAAINRLEVARQLLMFRAFDEFTAETSVKFRLLGVARTLKSALFQRASWPVR
jgi:hypothetical protein